MQEQASCKTEGSIEGYLSMRRVLSCYFDNNGSIAGLICTYRINFFFLYLDLT